MDLAYLQRRDYRQAARELGLSEVEARRRMRLGLQMLSTAIPRSPAGDHTGDASRRPPGTTRPGPGAARRQPPDDLGGAR